MLNSKFFLKPTFILIADFIPFEIVVPPVDLAISYGQDSQTINILDFGEMEIFGNKKVSQINFSSFFPSLNSHFYSYRNPLIPVLAVKLLDEWKTNNKKVKFLVPEWGLLFNCKIQTLNTTMTDHTGDVYFNITLIEDRQLEQKATETGLYKRG